MKNTYILKKKREIDPLFKSRLRRGNKYFTVFSKKDKENANFKFSMSIGRKYGNAVERNKIKRQIRSIIRENQLLISKENNFVVVIKPPAKQLNYEEINNYILELLIKLKVLEKNTNEKH